MRFPRPAYDVQPTLRDLQTHAGGADDGVRSASGHRCRSPNPKILPAARRQRARLPGNGFDSLPAHSGCRRTGPAGWLAGIQISRLLRKPVWHAAMNADAYLETQRAASSVFQASSRARGT